MIAVRNSRNYATSRRAAVAAEAIGSYQRRARLKPLGFRLTRPVGKRFIMTFNAKIYSVQPSMREAGRLYFKGLMKMAQEKPKTPLMWQKDVNNDFCKITQYSVWEDEGGAYFDCTHAILRDRSINFESALWRGYKTSETP